MDKQESGDGRRREQMEPVWRWTRTEGGDTSPGVERWGESLGRSTSGLSLLCLYLASARCTFGGTISPAHAAIGSAESFPRSGSPLAWYLKYSFCLNDKSNFFTINSKIFKKISHINYYHNMQISLFKTSRRPSWDLKIHILELSEYLLAIGHLDVLHAIRF